MKEMKTDIIVVAAGLSGLAAAISSAENGASVIAFEKANTTGGAANMGMGPLGVGSRFQRKNMISITPGEAFRKHMNFTHWRADPRLVRDYYFKSGETIDWLEDMGVEFLAISKVYPVPEAMRPYATSEETWHVVKPSDGSTNFAPRMASSMMKAMTERATELGVDIQLNTPVKKLISENGKIVGVVAENSEGDLIEARANAVILATGGAGDNPEMIKKLTGYEWGKDLFSFRIPGMNGDGLKMAWDAGASSSDVVMELMYVVPDNLNHFIADGAFRQPCLWVNTDGVRFMNEDSIGNTTFAGNAISTQPNRHVYSIFDSSLLKHYKRNGPDITSHVHPHDMYDHFEEAITADIEQGYEHVFAADSITELAEKMGVDPISLNDTVDSYNEMCASGHDDLFEKDHMHMKPLKKSKFYACRYFPGAYGTLGGIKINYKTEVVTPDNKPIPGLYAVGLDSCAIYGDSYPFILPGNTMGFAINSGRIAGENAVQSTFE